MAGFGTRWAGGREGGRTDGLAGELAGALAGQNLRWVETMLLGCAGALLGILGWVLLAPVGNGSGGGAGESGPLVLDAPARAALFGQFDPFARDGGGGAGPLPLTLLGTRSGPGGEGGSAIVAGPDGVQKVVLQGEEALPGLRLVRVDFDTITLSRAGGRVTLAMKADEPEGDAANDNDPADAGDQTPSAKAPSDKTPSEKAPSQPIGTPVSSGLHFEAVGQGGRVVGLAPHLAQQGGGAAFGLLAGDTIVAIEGRAVSGAQDGIRLAEALRAGRALGVTVRRGGRDLPLSLGAGPPELARGVP
ncbi:type II secretion system protein N [Novosphingobium pituita]|uniref:Type II secretion system protein GspC N-terminal domain-containing protein n=1 Tax=Novosphingobium pituita TaxID=3056842 RepID=A0ABQ6P8G1_9SPHN|nr:type II secretion system protein N [Novosphingobium sp. IK01]GMM60672.1 hypothetical protein NUTIK01_14490 [Novosphingobium sp. IK01]